MIGSISFNGASLFTLVAETYKLSFQGISNGVFIWSAVNIAFLYGLLLILRF